MSGLGLGADGFGDLASSLHGAPNAIEELDVSCNLAGVEGLLRLVTRLLLPRARRSKRRRRRGDGGGGGGEHRSRHGAAHSSNNNNYADDEDENYQDGNEDGDYEDEEEDKDEDEDEEDDGSLPLRRLYLHGDVEGNSSRGRDLSGVETLAACLARPDAACRSLDLITVGGGALLPVAHLKVIKEGNSKKTCRLPGAT